MGLKTKKVRIVSRQGEPFHDRQEAGRLLAAELKRFSGGETVVLGIPRGGVVVAAELARSLGAQLDIVLSRKIGAPGNLELAIGAVSEDGRLSLNENIVQGLGIRPDYLEKEKNRQLAEIARRRDVFRKVRPKISLHDRPVVLVDDGVATGATLQAAIWAVREETPQNIIVAVPVGPEETIHRLAQQADEVVCLRVPAAFYALSQFYVTFDQIEDSAVLAILQETA